MDNQEMDRILGLGATPAPQKAPAAASTGSQGITTAVMDKILGITPGSSPVPVQPTKPKKQSYFDKLISTTPENKQAEKDAFINSRLAHVQGPDDFKETIRGQLDREWELGRHPLKNSIGVMMQAMLPMGAAEAGTVAFAARNIIPAAKFVGGVALFSILDKYKGIEKRVPEDAKDWFKDTVSAVDFALKSAATMGLSGGMGFFDKAKLTSDMGKLIDDKAQGKKIPPLVIKQTKDLASEAVKRFEEARLKKKEATIKGILEQPAGSKIAGKAEQGKTVYSAPPDIQPTMRIPGGLQAGSPVQDQRGHTGTIINSFIDPDFNMRFYTVNFGKDAPRAVMSEGTLTPLQTAPSTLKTAPVASKQPQKVMGMPSESLMKAINSVAPKLTSADAPQPMKAENLPSANKAPDPAPDLRAAITRAKAEALAQGKKALVFNTKGEVVDLTKPELAKPPDQPAVIYKGEQVRFYNEKGMESVGIVANDVPNMPENKIYIYDTNQKDPMAGKPIPINPNQVIRYSEETALPLAYVKQFSERYKTASVIGDMVNKGLINSKDFVRQIHNVAKYTIIGIKKRGTGEGSLLPQSMENDALSLAEHNRMSLDEYLKDITQLAAERLLKAKIKPYNPDNEILQNWVRDKIEKEVHKVMVESSMSPDQPDWYKSQWWKKQLGKITPEQIKAAYFQVQKENPGIKLNADQLAEGIAKKLIPYKFQKTPDSPYSYTDDLYNLMNIKKIGRFQSLTPATEVEKEDAEFEKLGFKTPALSKRQKMSLGEEGQLNLEIIQGTLNGLAEPHVTSVKSGIKATKSTLDWIRSVTAPTTKVSRQAMDIMMTAKGKFEKDLFMADRATRKIENMWDAQPEEASLKFMDDVENNRPTHPEFQNLADFYRGRLDDLYNAIAQHKNINFLDNFFPHFWKDPDKVSSDFIPGIMGRRPLQGSKSFLKQRVFKTIQDGIEAGYEPVSKNPETLMKLYEHNVRKFLMAQELKNEYIDKGLWKFVRKGAPFPDGFVPINDRIAKVYFPPDVAEVSLGGEPTRKMVEAGEYYVQKDLARIINNYLSRDLLMDTSIGRGLLNAKNSLNAFQLGASAFHFTAMTIDAATTRLSIGLQWLEKGNVGKALKTVMTAPAAPIAYFKTGARFFDNPETQGFVDDLFRGGASLRDKQYYKNSILDQFMRDVRSKKYMSLFNPKNIGAIPELTMRPLFAYYIPRLKVGAWAELYKQQLELNAGKIEQGQESAAHIARMTWNNIENRMGEINYDNFFWHRGFKGAMMLMFRAVGWQAGKVRELGGAFFDDLPRQVVRLGRGQGFEFTPKMNYTLSLFLMTGFIGGLIHYLSTGKRPERIVDYYYPENGSLDEYGNKTRVILPTQLKDIYKETMDLPGAIRNKIAPEFNMISEFFTNRDFYGDYITNEHDNLPKRFKQIEKWFLESFSPISVRNVVALSKGESGLNTKDVIESFFGFVKAPREISQTPFERDLYKAMTEQEGGTRGPRTPERKAEDELKAKARRELRHGVTTTFRQLMVNGALPTKQSQEEFLKGYKLTPEERLMLHLHNINKVGFFKEELEKIEKRRR